MMEFRGKVSGLTQDYETGKYVVSFAVGDRNEFLPGYDSIKDADILDIRVVKHRRKRSLDANAYAWVLMGKIASALRTSKEEVYEEMLRRYGVLYEDEDGYIAITLKASVDIMKLEGHWQLVLDNGASRTYAMVKGSSQYDTREMSQFIDGVVYEAKGLGIETLSPRELEHMKLGWSP